VKGPSSLFACAAALACALASAGVVSSCSDVPADARIGILAPNGSDVEFGPVGNYLEHRCGTLDCHGQMVRNFRVFGCEGMRVDPNVGPGCTPPPLGGGFTTPAEHSATYRSLVGLEPSVMSEVVAGHGLHPELLTFVRKARGLDAHKGGTIITPGDDQDVCITSWLAGNTDMTACGLATGYPMFPLDASFE
jgi:hypothetical protein